MMTKRKLKATQLLRAALGCGLAAMCAWSTPGALAQDEGEAAPPPERPRGRPRPGVGPPNIPAFDRELAQKYIDEIDQERNAISLKMGLFMRRAGALSTDDAFAMLEEALKKEAVGSKKWFLIQSVRGFGGYQTPTTADISNEAYAAIFDHVDDAAKAEASGLVEQALSSYLSTVQNRSGLRRGDNSTSPEVLLKAFEAYLRLAPNPNALQPFELQWEQALRAIGGEKEFVATVDRLLKEPKASENYRLLRAAASAYDHYDPERAIELLQQARPLALRQNPKLLEAYYSDLVRLMATNGQLPAAIAAQQELIKLSGQGSAQLLLLLDKAGDAKAFDAAVTSLLAPDSSEADLVATATGLRPLARNNARLWNIARELHAGYFAVERKRTPELELRARLSFANILTEEKKLDEAKAILTFDHIKPPFESFEAQRSYDAIQRILAGMEKSAAPAPQP